MGDNRIPIQRSNKFFSEEDFQLEQEFGREYMQDINMTAILYRVNKETTDTDDLYGEVKKDAIKFFPPVEIQCVATIEEAENKSYNNNGSMRHLEPGSLILDIFQQHLDELCVDVSYGDYFGYAVDETTLRFYTVVNDGKVNYDNTNTIGGYKPAYRQITCIVTDESEFTGT